MMKTLDPMTSERFTSDLSGAKRDSAAQSVPSPLFVWPQENVERRLISATWILRREQEPVVATQSIPYGEDMMLEG